MRFKRNPDAMCGTCPYWAQAGVTAMGTCRKNPPVASFGGAVFPIITMEDPGCGAHPELIAREEEPDTPKYLGSKGKDV